MTLAIIPAKRHSVGVPDKNWKPIAPDGNNCVQLAVEIGLRCANRRVVSTDYPEVPRFSVIGIECVPRPADLPDTMLAVVQHTLEAVPGPDDEIIVLLQPSSPLRTVETVRKAIRMLEEDKEATSVVSVSPSYPVEWTLRVDERGYIARAAHAVYGPGGPWPEVMPARRQDCDSAYKRDGVVYAFRRSTLAGYGDIYGTHALPLHTTPAEALSIDTPADWDEAVRRLSNSAGSPAADTSARL